jgi:hypothetical protein
MQIEKYHLKRTITNHHLITITPLLNPILKLSILYLKIVIMILIELTKNYKIYQREII